ncbi:MAG: PAS domain-containing protein, partial [Desulfofustis sp.]
MESSNHLRIKKPDIGYITIDRDGRITSCNEQSAALLGASMEELLGQTIHAAVADDPRFAPLAQRLN